MMLVGSKQEIQKQFQRKEGDTGSPEVQIALNTAAIQKISEHLKLHRKDIHCKRGLLAHVSNRRAMLDYLKRKRPEAYQTILKALGLRR